MTLAFVKPSVVQSKDGTGQPHENGPVNLALCMSIQRGKMNNGWFVCFKASSGVSSLWWFESEDARDKDYQAVMLMATYHTFPSYIVASDIVANLGQSLKERA